MRGGRGLVLFAAMLIALAIGPVAALADPGNGNGNGKPSPTPSPSPTESPSATPEPTASWRDGGGSSGGTDTAPAPDGTEGGGSSGSGSGGGGGNGHGPGDATSDHGGSGIVKLDRRPFDHAPNNEPHVGCTFQVDFYNYPTGVTARYTFFMWPPTGHEELMSGNIALERDPSGGGLDLDGQETVELGPALLATEIDPHAHNGWHVKVVVHARHTSGPDQKQKVFWVRGCKAEHTPTTTSPPIPPSTVTPPGPVAFTGSDATRLVGLMFLLLFLGTAAMRIGRRLEDGA